ncbi:hypothetical protein P879_04393 [Paragonimus westermani]|uniref:Uncharacterized protein n=1 Tax=Paragonimus westermani TaxID=34504 RepID=A0A8T0DQW6_9TREM|nr:hypothetical protein P879_04393 [Paragonimus westermani]
MSIDSHPTEELDLEYAEPPNHVSSISNTVEYSRHSLSTLQETPSLDSVRRRSHVNASANGHREEDNKSVEELEIMDGSEENLHRRSVNLKTSRSPKTGDRSRNSANYIQRRSPYNDSTLSDSVDSRRKANYDRSARRHDWLIARNGYSSYNTSPIDYWTLPRTQEIFRRNFDHPDTLYQTPGGLLYPRKSHGHRSSRKSHKHRQNKEDRLVEQHLTRKQLDSSRKDVERDSLDLNSAEIPHRSELKVYFRFSKGTLSDRSGLDYLQNEPLLEALQAQCRGWLARQAFDRLLDQNEAVRTIQRNAERLFNPWIRLMLTLRPLLKSHRTEEELLFLRSELERYKTLVKMLRFENAEYQAKVANLLQLIEQINTKGSNNEVVNTLVQQLRQDADFYRNQVEMLKEEADEQQHRSSEHFQGQVSVLSDRVEHLQHLLAMESSKVHRLSSELEEMNNTIAEAKTHERNLEHMVSQLSKQLDQRSRARESSLTPETPSPLLSKLPPDAEKQGGDMASTNQDLEKQLNSYRQLIAQLRTYLASNPKAMSILSNSPFQPGGEMDLFNEPNSALFSSSAYISVDPMLNSSLYTQPGSPMREDRSLGGDLTPRSSTTHEVAELKRQLNVAERNLMETGEKIKHEIEDRETLENENMQLHNRVAALDRQLRRTQDEYDEAMTRRDLVHQRKLKELTEQLEDELRKNSQMSEQNKELERELTELRNMAEPDEENVNDQWESMRSKLRSDVNQYKRALEILQDEFDQFRRENDPQTTQQQLTERDEKINLLENEKQQWRLEMEVLQVKLQNATSILEDTENRLKQATRERTTQIHRITQLESERDEAIREAANISGRASAEKENAAAKLREFEELRIERDGLRRELTDLKQTLAGCTAENAAEKRQLQARLREMEGHHEARISDFKAELERTREEMERLQVGHVFKALDAIKTVTHTESINYSCFIGKIFYLK